MNEKQQLGLKGEAAAASFFQRRGYRILARNYRTRQGEIDLIAVKDQVLTFVEVKTRTTDAFGIPAAAVTYRKQQKIRAVALQFLQEQDQYYRELTFDVLEVWAAGDKAKLRWLPHCF